MKTQFARASMAGLVLPFAVVLALLAGCDGSRGKEGPPGPAGDSGDTDTDLGRRDTPPGVNVVIKDVSGGSGSGGSFSPGDRVAVTFTVLKDDGTSWKLDEMSAGVIMVSGPSFNYQRVIPDQRDVLTRSEAISPGTYRYAFSSPIPDTYLAPANDSAAFGPADGELTGRPLLNGTYTVGMYVTWTFDFDGESTRDAGNATADFLLGGGGALEPREVVGQANCNACHSDLRAHGSQRKDVKLCILCHTSGAEDRNVASAAGGTPGASIDFRVMIHKIHNAAHLPSVLGVTTRADGSRDYAAEPRPYRLVGFGDRVIDFSHVAFPVWPNLNMPMPRDGGYSGLSSADRATEDEIRRGVTDCDKCHGDPDGDGPLEAPRQGSVALAQPSRRSCGACHDDVVWEHKYTGNMSTMPENTQDSACVLCHKVSGDTLAVRDAHRHPVLNPAVNPGLAFEIVSVSEAGTADGDEAVDPGEKIALVLDVKDAGGRSVAPSTASSINVVVSGPVENRTLVLSTSIPAAALTGAPPYRINVPQPIAFEWVGDSTAEPGDVFMTRMKPVWNVSGVSTTVQVVTGPTGASTLLDAGAAPLQNFLDVSGSAGFSRDDFVVIDDGTSEEEYSRITLVDGGRLWISPPLRFAHAPGSGVDAVSVSAKTAGTHYVLDAPNGILVETDDFGDGNAVLVSYTSDFVMPAVFAPPLNESPDLDETWAEWTGMPVVSGTYTLGLWGGRPLAVSVAGETTSYTAGAPPSRVEFRVGTAGDLDEYPFISSARNCDSCHNDVFFHGGARRGFETCILCHGVSGSEDRARYTAGNAPATPGATIDFRTMLHKIHAGSGLAEAEDYVVVGFGGSPYPNNFTPHTYAEVGFPAMPGGAMECRKCHGSDNMAWVEPSRRSHPTAGGLPAREWRAACGSCHDSAGAKAHIESQTSRGGAEACAVCHDFGAKFPVDLAHKRP